MSDENISQKAKEAIRHIRNYLMQTGRFPSVRVLMALMGYKSPRSGMLIMEELEVNGFLHKKDDGSYLLVKDLEDGHIARTVAVPLIGSIACGTPLLALENIEALIAVSISIAKPGANYFLLKALGDSMDKSGIFEGDLLLVKQQTTATNGQNIVALIDDEATVKKYHHKGAFVTLLPHSNNKMHQPIILTENFRIQGIVVAVIPK
jgi:repressor LexA